MSEVVCLTPTRRRESSRVVKVVFFRRRGRNLFVSFISPIRWTNLPRHCFVVFWFFSSVLFSINFIEIFLFRYVFCLSFQRRFIGDTGSRFACVRLSTATAISTKMSSDQIRETGEKKETASSRNNSNSKISAPATPEPAGVKPTGPPPADGGLTAWLQVAGGFIIFFNTWGLINTFAVFQTYYESGALFTESSSNISWIGSIQCFLLQLTGIVAGPIYDRGYLRLLLVIRSVMVVFGYMMLSLCHEYWQALLAQAICVGLGSGLLFTPTVSLLPTWFSSHIGLAVGIASSGSSLGGVIYPIVLYRLIGPIGFPWAIRTLAFIALGTFIIRVVI